MSFDEVIGQPTADRTLRAALRSRRIAGAYLFHGPDGVGKLRMARAFARALLCERDGEDACGDCSSCRRTRSGVHPNVLELGREPKATFVKIHQIRAVCARLSLKPLEGTRQVVLLDPADRMNPEAGNALLKTLEEPPAGAVLVLVTAEPLRVLETIRSRCQPVRFRPLGREQVRAVLDEEEIPPEEAEALARLSGGSPGRALALRRLGFPERARAVLHRFLDVGRDDPVAIAGDLVRWEPPDDRSAARLAATETLRLLAALARDAMVASTGARDQATTVPQDALGAALERFGRDESRWGKVLRRLLEAAHNVQANVGIDLILVDLLLDIEGQWKSPNPRPPSRPRSATAS